MLKYRKYLMKKKKNTRRFSITLFATICIVILTVIIGAYFLSGKRTTKISNPSSVSTADWKTYYGDSYSIMYPSNFYITERYGKGFTNFQTGEGDTWMSIAVDSREMETLNNFTNAKVTEKKKLHNVVQTNIPNGIAFTGMEGDPSYQQEYVTYAIYNDNDKAIEVSIRTLVPLSFQKIEPILLKFHIDTPQEIANLQKQTTLKYISRIFDFSMNYPKTWLLDEEKNSVSFIESVNSLGGQSGDTLQRGIIRIYPNYNPQISILDYLQSEGEVRIVIDKEEDTTINGIPVVWYSKASEDLSKTKFEGVVLKKNNNYLSF